MLSLKFFNLRFHMPGPGVAGTKTLLNFQSLGKILNADWWGRF